MPAARPGVVGLLLVAPILLLAASPVVPDASAARSVSASFGVLGRTTLHATATTTGVPGGERVVLDGRRGGRPTSVVDRTTVRGGIARLSWRFSKPGPALHVRVRVVRGTGSRARTIAASPWRILRTGGLRRGAPLAPVRSADVVSAPAPGTRGDLVLRRSRGLRVRDVVVLPSSRTTPDGLLVQVRGLRRAGSATVARVVPALLPDVMPVGDLSVSAAATDPPSLQGSDGVGRFNGGMDCDAPFPAIVSGTASMSTGLRLRTSWRASTSLERPNVTSDLRTDTRAALDAGVLMSGGARCELTGQPLFARPQRLQRISTSIGPLPVTLTVDGQVVVSASTATLGAISAAARGSARATTRTVYDGIEATQTGRLTTRLRPHDTAVTASGGAQVGLTPSVDLRVFGLAGPALDFAAGARTTADIATRSTTPWWRTVVPDELGGTFALQAWRSDLESPRIRLDGHQGELQRAARPPGGSSQTAAARAPDPLPAAVVAALRWDSSARVELHAWDAAGHHAWARDPEAIPGVTVRTSVSDTGPVVTDVVAEDPGVPLTIGVCQADGTESKATLDVRAGDGSAVRHVVVLRGRLAAALPATTPVGAPAIAPPAGWCGREGGDPSALGQVSTGDLSSTRPTALHQSAPWGSDAPVARVRQTGGVTTGTQGVR